ncbi:transport permease protein [Lentzea sp. NBRC 105346]|uniref:ABC transporter permease n=1 Tax=Lentzea sp. NBRC 105346 TaxID=3032205 RepID=UPI0024A3586F|nr:ABC transporter permease [Lentzea sp. NBRC 105346]GLZ34969.1 transport permease protein [Lentzea sp. NBRC 105346]
MATLTWQGSSYLTQVKVLTGRSLRKFVNSPALIFFSILQPVIMLTLFSQIFSSITATANFAPGMTYVNYLLPAILVNTAMQSSLQSGVGLVTDMKDGVIARFRSLPIRLSTILLARNLSDLVRVAGQLLLMITFGVLVYGFNPAGGVLGTLAALGLALVVGWGLSWLFLAIGSWLRNAELMQTIGFLAMFPLMFASSAFVPIQGLPGWLQVVAKVNPLTYAVDAARSLALAQPVTGVIGALTTSLGIAVVCAVIAIRGFRRPL